MDSRNLFPRRLSTRQRDLRQEPAHTRHVPSATNTRALFMTSLRNMGPRLQLKVPQDVPAGIPKEVALCLYRIARLQGDLARVRCHCSQLITISSMT